MSEPDTDLPEQSTHRPAEPGSSSGSSGSQLIPGQSPDTMHSFLVALGSLISTSPHPTARVYDVVVVPTPHESLQQPVSEGDLLEWIQGLSVASEYPLTHLSEALPSLYQKSALPLHHVRGFEILNSSTLQARRLLNLIATGQVNSDLVLRRILEIIDSDSTLFQVLGTFRNELARRMGKTAREPAQCSACYIPASANDGLNGALFNQVATSRYPRLLTSRKPVKQLNQTTIDSLKRVSDDLLDFMQSISWITEDEHLRITEQMTKQEQVVEIWNIVQSGRAENALAIFVGILLVLVDENRLDQRTMGKIAKFLGLH